MIKVILAELLAAYAHREQVDKAGAPYIGHPRAVAAQMESEEEKAVAFLHDVLEDTDVPPETIRELFGEDITRAVEAMTHRPGESYEEYIRRLARDPLARAVKLADLRHNMDLSRLPQVTDRDRERVEKYRRAADYLRSFD